MVRPRSDVYIRFNSKVLEVESGCKEWQSTIKKDGYGSFHYEGKQVQAHRVAFILQVGEIPSGKVIMHRCDNRKCVNIDHLVLGTNQENIADMDAKERRASKRLLTDSQIEEIREMLAARYTQDEIARKFHVHQGTISKIKLSKLKFLRKSKE